MLRVIHKESDLPLDKDPIRKAEFKERFIAAHNKRIQRLKAQGKHYSQQYQETKFRNHDNQINS